MAWLVAGFLVLIAVPAVAQDRNEPPPLHRIVASGGWTTFFREEAPSSQGGHQGLTFAVAVPLSRRFAVEGSASLLGRSSRDWHLDYLFTVQGDMRTFDRDVPIVGSLRIAEQCLPNSCIEFVIGGGLNLHKINTRRLTICQNLTGGRVCTPVDPGSLGDAEEYIEPMVSVGADFNLRASRRLSIAPGFRLNVIFRDRYLTGWLHRGPRNVGEFAIFAGLNVRLLQ